MMRILSNSKKCNSTGTTEESIANAKFKTDLTHFDKVHKDFVNFVLMDYGLGAVFGCPAHDQKI